MRDEQLWLPFQDCVSPSQPTPQFGPDIVATSLPEPDDSPAYQRFGFVIKDLPRDLRPSLRWMHWTRR